MSPEQQLEPKPITLRGIVKEKLEPDIGEEFDRLADNLVESLARGLLNCNSEQEKKAT